MAATERSIAADLRTYLRETPGVCATGNVHGWQWVRYHSAADVDGENDEDGETGEWQAVRYASRDPHLRSYVVGETLDADGVLKWLVANPVEVIPAAEAYRWQAADETVWEDATRQDVFADADRCVYCGASEHHADLGIYETDADGDCRLCPACRESWERAGEIISELEAPA